MAKEMVSGLAPTGSGDIYFERRGDGPPLLLIVGGGGDCAYYAQAAEFLMEHYSVVSYDRRGSSRSVLAACGQELTMPRQSADALAVLACNGFASARVFGNSGGATIALDLAAHHPEVVRAAVFHEPPVPKVLPQGPDRARYLGIADEVDHLVATGTCQAALALFLERIGGLPADRPEALTTVLDPARVLPPGPPLEVMLRLSHNWEFMIRYEIRPSSSTSRISRAWWPITSPWSWPAEQRPPTPRW
jgi:pimeloyl-ACP methyl ester carboxylesterase